MSVDRPVRFADETEVRGAQLMTPELANQFGNVHGGQMMRLSDEIAYVCAARYCGGVAVTAAVDRIDFHEPIHVGELLHLVARVVYVGRTSMEIEVSIHAEEIASGRQRHTNTCQLTFVALENVENGRPRLVPRLVCRTRDDKARFIQARMRRERGMEYREERNQFLDEFAHLTDDALDALIPAENRP